MKRHLRQRLAGQNLVEFALIGTVFFLMLYGTIEMGRLMWTNHELANGTREAARFAMVHGSEASSQATDADVRSEILSHSVGIADDGRLEIITAGLGGDPGDKIVIDATYDFNFVVGIIPGLSTLELHHRSEVIVQH